MYLIDNDKDIKILPSLTYVNWHRKGCTLPVTFQKDDLEELTRQCNLFARKFDTEFDTEILDLLDEYNG